MSKCNPATKNSLKLYNALRDRGIKPILEFWDGHKHVDICIPEAKIYIEIDGLYHFIDSNQIIADFKRDNYSENDGYKTIRIPDEVLEKYTEEVASAVIEVVKSA